MEPSYTHTDIPSQKQSTNFFTTVTPFSKYLALISFIAFPFVGGYMGYTIASQPINQNLELVTAEFENLNQEESADWSFESIDSWTQVSVGEIDPFDGSRSINFEQRGDIRFSFEGQSITFEIGSIQSVFERIYDEDWPLYLETRPYIDRIAFDEATQEIYLSLNTSTTSLFQVHKIMSNESLEQAIRRAYPVINEYTSPEYYSDIRDKFVQNIPGFTSDDFDAGKHCELTTWLAPDAEAGADSYRFVAKKEYVDLLDAAHVYDADELDKSYDEFIEYMCITPAIYRAGNLLFANTGDRTDAATPNAYIYRVE